MNLDVTAETRIARSRKDVAAYVIDNRNDTIWIGGITESELQGEPPIRVGSRVRRVASFARKRIDYVNEVERLDPVGLLEMRSVKSPFPMRVTYRFTDDGGATTVYPCPGRSRHALPCSGTADALEGPSLYLPRSGNAEVAHGALTGAALTRPTTTGSTSTKPPS